jgi:hypothetical protein
LSLGIQVTEKAALAQRQAADQVRTELAEKSQSSKMLKEKTIKRRK